MKAPSAKVGRSNRLPVANAGPLASALIEAAAQYPEVDSLDLDAVEKAEIAAKDRMLAACGSREIFRPTKGKEDMKARTLLLTIALVALSSQAMPCGMLCGEFARHTTLLARIPVANTISPAIGGIEVEFIGASRRDGDLVFRPSSPRWQDRRTLQWQYVPGQVRQ